MYKPDSDASRLARGEIGLVGIGDEPGQGVGYLDLTGCMALGITGPVLRSRLNSSIF